MVGIRGERLGKWWYGDLAGESVTHCLCGLSPGDRGSLIEKEILLKECPIRRTQLLVHVLYVRLSTFLNLSKFTNSSELYLQKGGQSESQSGDFIWL